MTIANESLEGQLLNLFAKIQSDCARGSRIAHLCDKGVELLSIRSPSVCEGKVTEEMVERAHAAYAKTTGGMLDGNPMRNALTAALNTQDAINAEYEINFMDSRESK